MNFLETPFSCLTKPPAFCVHWAARRSVPRAFLRAALPVSAILSASSSVIEQRPGAFVFYRRRVPRPSRPTNSDQRPAATGAFVQAPGADRPPARRAGPPLALGEGVGKPVPHGTGCCEQVLLRQRVPENVFV